MTRLFEIIFCLIIFILIIPILILISILIKIDSKGPVIFSSERFGINKTKFMMPKFRTMKEGTEIIETDKLKNSQEKITRFGKFLRKYSLDELPQLISVIVGDLALVGPRPALISQKELISKREELGINKIKPGITGYAQINGRDLLSLDEKIELEIEYMEKKTFLFDILIIFKSLKVFFKNNEILH